MSDALVGCALKAWGVLLAGVQTRMAAPLREKRTSALLKPPLAWPFCVGGTSGLLGHWPPPSKCRPCLTVDGGWEGGEGTVPHGLAEGASLVWGR